MTFVPRDDGPAYPSAEYETIHGDEVVVRTGHSGMSLRDWFAGQFAAAMLQGTLGRFDDGTLSAYRSGKCNHVIADRAYTLADAMLRMRATGGQTVNASRWKGRTDGAANSHRL